MIDEKRPFLPFIRIYVTLLVLMVILSIIITMSLGFISMAAHAQSPLAFSQFITTLEEVSRSFIDLVEITVGSIIGALAASTQLSVTGKPKKREDLDSVADIWYFIRTFLLVMGVMMAAAIIVFALFGNIAINIDPHNFASEDVFESILIALESISIAFIDSLEIIIGSLIGVLSASLNHAMTIAAKLKEQETTA
jgi:hypothetical protein